MINTDQHQEMFDRVIAHFRRQKARSSYQGSDYYRTPKGLSDPIGCLFTRHNYELYLKAKEGTVANDKSVVRAVREGTQYKNFRPAFLNDLQLAHDLSYSTPEFFARMVILALKWKISGHSASQAMEDFFQTMETHHQTEKKDRLRWQSLNRYMS